MKVIIEPFEEQAQFIVSNARFLVAMSGNGGGKTYAGWAKFLRAMDSLGEGNYLICAPTYKILSQGTLRSIFTMTPFIQYFHRKSDQVIDWNRRVVFLRSLDTPQSIEGIPKCKMIWVDEIGGISYPAWIAIQSRSSQDKCQVIGTTTWYCENWFHYEFLPKARKDGETYRVIEWDVTKNPTFDKKEYERAKRDMNPIDFAIRYEGKEGAKGTRVYPENPQVFSISDSERIRVGGIDWGHSMPFALVVIDYEIKTRRFIVTEAHKLTQPSYSDIEALCKLVGQGITFYCDPSRPDLIQEFGSRGISMAPAIRERGMRTELEAGEARIRELIHQKRFGCTAKTYSLVMEEVFGYITDKRDAYDEYGKRKRKGAHHILDAIRYAIYTRFPVQLSEPAESKSVYTGNLLKGLEQYTIEQVYEMTNNEIETVVI